MFMRRLRRRRGARAIVVGGAIALLFLAMASDGIRAQDDDASAEATPADEGLPESMRPPFIWSATSPATNLGDEYQLVVENTSDVEQTIRVYTIVMDHQQHVNTMVVDEEVTLAPGEQRELTAVNEYGTANHFSTRIGSPTGDVADLTLTVTVTDATGAETAHFNQLAFLIRETPALGERLGRHQAAEAHQDHAADEPAATPAP